LRWGSITRMKLRSNCFDNQKSVNIQKQRGGVNFFIFQLRKYIFCYGHLKHLNSKKRVSNEILTPHSFDTEKLHILGKWSVLLPLVYLCLTLPYFCLFALSVLFSLLYESYGMGAEHKQPWRQHRIKWFGNRSKWARDRSYLGKWLNNKEIPLDSNRGRHKEHVLTISFFFLIWPLHREKRCRGEWGEWHTFFLNGWHSRICQPN
jgi:hypothetical protein